MEIKFRSLRADEIDVRVAKIKENGCQLLLYKDARCDMNILDETVGSTNWMRTHSRNNANCIVSIWDDGKQQWIAKEDTGTESNTEKEKGLASDSFKRACVNWGIGRELYTSPFIWITPNCLKIVERNGRKATDDRFCVDRIKTEGGVIKELVIRNATQGRGVFSWPNAIQTDEPNRQTTPESTTQAPPPSPQHGANNPVVLICSECKRRILATKTRTAQQVAESTQERYGRMLCTTCANREQRELDAIVTEALHDEAGDRI